VPSISRQSVRLYDGKIMTGMDPMGRKHYWFAVVPLEPAEEGTDRWAVENNYVSITPLRLDLTNEEELRKEKTAAKDISIEMFSFIQNNQ